MATAEVADEVLLTQLSIIPTARLFIPRLNVGQ